MSKDSMHMLTAMPDTFNRSTAFHRSDGIPCGTSNKYWCGHSWTYLQEWEPFQTEILNVGT